MVSARSRRQLAAAWLSIAALLSGCIRMDEYIRPTYVVRSMYPVSPAICPRILLLPPACDDCTAEELALLAELFRAELVEAGYAVPAPKPGDAPPPHAAPADPETVQRIAESAGVDAVLVLRVRHYRPYRPPVLDLDASVYTATGPGPAWELHGVWDPRDRKVAARLQRFAQQEIEPSVFRLGHSAVLYAPHVFLRFVAHEVVTAMASGELPAAEAGPGAESSRPGNASTVLE